jgi:hypothetical protein
MLKALILEMKCEEDATGPIISCHGLVLDFFVFLDNIEGIKLEMELEEDA